MAGTVEIRIEGIDRLTSLLQNGRLYRQPVREGMEELGRQAVAAARAGAPRGRTGQLAGRLEHKIRGGSGERLPYVVVRTDATATPANPRARRGRTRYPYSYPRRLEFDPRSSRRDWLLNAIRRASLGRAAEGIARRIERQWGGR